MPDQLHELHGTSGMQRPDILLVHSLCDLLEMSEMHTSEVIEPGFVFILFTISAAACSKLRSLSTALCI